MTSHALLRDTDDDDEPQDSSAAQCISLRLLNKDFKPEFTHQCFDGEWIRGYQPTSIHGSHKSHTNHELATHELKLTITMAPSCQMCHADLDICRKPVNASVERPQKRRKLLSKNKSSSSEESHGESESDRQDDDEDYSEQEKEEDRDYHSDAGSTRHRRMHPDEILERVGRGTPKISKESKEFVEEDYLRQPIGKILKTYSRTIDGGSFDFVLTIANSDQASDYHNQVQKLALFFIESADCVNLSSNNGGGYWKALYLFRKHGTRKYGLCGYMTLFHFHAPFRKPRPGTVARICQALLLPPYQRMGHGKAMMRAVHDMAAGSDIVEINVEDPAPGFILLRNRVDYELLVESLDTDEPWLPQKYRRAGSFLALSDLDMSKAASLGRITTRQVQIAYELYKLNDLSKADAASEKKYRLMVKKRLLNLHREHVGAYKTKEERQILLDEFWKTVIADHKSVLKRN